MHLLRAISVLAAAVLIPTVAVGNPFSDREPSSLSNVGGVLEGMQQAFGDANPDERRMMLVGVGAILMLLFLMFAALRSSR